MAFLKGNQCWKARARHGRPPLFDSPEALWDACCEYFEWVEDNPLWEIKAFAYQGVVTQEKVAKMRAMTIGGLCLFLGIEPRTWRTYRERDDFLPITTRAESVMYEQKFTGAAADLLNPNIIARDLGLADKQDHTSSDRSMTPMPTRIELVAPHVDLPD